MIELGDNEPVSTAKLLACREEVLKSRRYAIGILSNGILEDPELRMKNFAMLLEFMQEKNPEVYITVRKLAAASLLEIFKDILPSYHIVQIKQDGIKRKYQNISHLKCNLFCVFNFTIDSLLFPVKKDTLQLQNFEAELLKYYKKYLQNLEKTAKVLYKKGNAMRKVGDREIQLAILTVNCMCDLLVAHPYFNFANNIAKFLIPLLDSKLPSIREAVLKCFTQIFKEDKRGDLSLSVSVHSTHPMYFLFFVFI